MKLIFIILYFLSIGITSIYSPPLCKKPYKLQRTFTSDIIFKNTSNYTIIKIYKKIN